MKGSERDGNVRKLERSKDNKNIYRNSTAEQMCLPGRNFCESES